MYPDKIFGFFHLYGLMIGLGLIVGFAVLFYGAKKKKLNEKMTDFVFYNGIFSIAFGFGAAALFQATYNYIENPSAGFDFDGGITFIGGLIGGIVFFLAVYFAMRKRLPASLTDYLSLAPCVILVAHAFGRVGCFFAGCCYGKPTDSFLGVQFPNLPGPVHATQLYEAAFLFALFGISFWLYMKKDFKQNLSLYLFAYGIFRFLIEFLRDDDRGQLLGLPPSQFWAIVMVAASVGVYFLVEYLHKKKPQINDKQEISKEQEQ